MLTALMVVYAQVNRFDEAMAVFSSLTERDPDAAIPLSKLKTLTAQLAKAARLDDVVAVMQRLKDAAVLKPTTLESSHPLFVFASLLFSHLANTGDADTLYKLYNRMKMSKILKFNEALLRPLVKVHLVRYDLPNPAKCKASYKYYRLKRLIPQGRCEQCVRTVQSLRQGDARRPVLPSSGCSVH